MKGNLDKKTTSRTKCGFVALVGLPNAGKSTLINLLVNEKISIVSFKAQTTRNEVRGIVEYDDSQIIYVDTPGICTTNNSTRINNNINNTRADNICVNNTCTNSTRVNNALEKILFKNFKRSIRNADVIIIVIDGSDKCALNKLKLNEKFLKNEFLKDKPVAIAINKIDLVSPKEKLLKIADELRKLEYVKEIFMISALNNQGIEPLKQFAKDSVLEGPWLYTEEHDITDTGIKTRLSEITREKIFENLEQELPYSIYVITDALRITDKKFKIIQTIITMKDSQKGIIIGRNGNMIKHIKLSAINEMKQIFHKNIDLKLFVRVKEKWTSSKDYLTDAGLI